MKLQRKILSLILALVMCLSLAACGCSNEEGQSDPEEIVGDDWRVTGVVKSSGTITRDGNDTYVLVCLSATEADFYHDSIDQVMFDFVDFPVAFENDPSDMFLSIDFADRTGDNNSDVAIMLDNSGEIILMVWFWDAESKSFVYQPEESQLSTNDEAQYEE